MGAVFGQHRICSCRLGEMTPEDRRRRAKELRVARKLGTAPPKLQRGLDCTRCGGTGYVKA